MYRLIPISLALLTSITPLLAQDYSQCDPDWSIFASLNATGNATFPAIVAPNSPDIGTWTFDIGQRQVNDSRSDTYSMHHTLWALFFPRLNASSPDDPYYHVRSCASLLGQLQTINSGANLGGGGDCTQLFGSACVNAIINQLNASALANSGQNTSVLSCPSLTSIPSACNSYATNNVASGASAAIISHTSNNSNNNSSQYPSYCRAPLGTNNPVTSSIFAVQDPGSASTSNLTLYDNALSTVYPIALTAWLDDNAYGGPWATTKLFCIRTDTVVQGSLAPGKTSGAVAVRLERAKAKAAVWVTVVGMIASIWVF